MNYHPFMSVCQLEPPKENFDLKDQSINLIAFNLAEPIKDIMPE